MLQDGAASGPWGECLSGCLAPTSKHHCLSWFSDGSQGETWVHIKLLTSQLQLHGKTLPPEKKYTKVRKNVCVLYLSVNVTDLRLLIVCEKLFWCLYSEEMWDSTSHCLIF